MNSQLPMNSDRQVGLRTLFKHSIDVLGREMFGVHCIRQTHDSQWVL